MSFVRRCLKDEGIPESASKYILKSWRTSTQKQYSTYLRQWEVFCDTRGINPISPPLESALEFLARLADRGLGYSVVNTARSALSAVLVLPNGTVFGQHSYVKRLLKGVFETKPALPCYTCIWDVEIVLKYLKNLGPNTELTLKLLTLKLVMLLGLGESKCVFLLTSLLKTSAPTRHLTHIEILAYPQDPKLCVINCLNAYLTRTKSNRFGTSQLFLSVQKPFKAVSRDTISRWLKSVLDMAGIDTTIFTAHSTRTASTSCAKAKGLPSHVIMAAADWHSESTFAKFYDKCIVKENFGGKLLEQ
jgi:hypothetical protein